MTSNSSGGLPVLIVICKRMNSTPQLVSKLNRLIDLLHESKKDNWVTHFEPALDLLRSGNLVKAKKIIRSAYGGIGSFNDTNFNFLSEKKYSEIIRLSNELYEYSKPDGR